MDSLTPERRSWNMQRIRRSDTRPERIVRSALHRLGYRFRLDGGKSLPGKPDVVLPKYRTAVFVHGCFWHRHAGCQFAYNPKSRTDFWQHKFNVNVQRDKLVRDKLCSAGWRVIEVWECQTGKPDLLTIALSKLTSEGRTK